MMASSQLGRSLNNALPAAARSTTNLAGTEPGRTSISTSRASISTVSTRPANTTNGSSGEGDKPIASAAGITVAVTLAEPHVYLTGFDHDGRGSNTENATAMIRGKMVLNVTKSVKIKAVTLTFYGKARTEWPEGKI
jgi:hypothetical protein